ncbi:MAG: hypothetical protein OXC11_13420 [Rhodospirillales bacterium]|nr:hypothetical protein [Rhodospirillales bacterium]
MTARRFKGITPEMHRSMAQVALYHGRTEAALRHQRDADDAQFARECLDRFPDIKRTVDNDRRGDA